MTILLKISRAKSGKRLCEIEELKKEYGGK